MSRNVGRVQGFIVELGLLLTCLPRIFQVEESNGWAGYRNLANPEFTVDETDELAGGSAIS